MNLFHIIDEGQAILRSRGVYKQVKIYRRDGRVFAQHGGGYIRLERAGGTSLPNASWLEVAGPGVSILNGMPMVSLIQPLAIAAE